MKDSARTIGDVRLLTALDEPGCPICHLAAESASSYIDALLWEMVNDPMVRLRLRRSLGFCPAHVGVAIRVAGRWGGQMGIAVLYEDFVSHLHARAVDAAKGVKTRRYWGGWHARAGLLQPVAPCSACEIAEGSVGHALRILMRSGPESEIGRRARGELRVLCAPHLAKGLARAQSEDEAAMLLDIYLRGEAELLADITELKRKHDYRYLHEPKGRESDAWLRGPRLIVGEP